MSKYTGKSATVPMAIGDVYAKLSNLSQYQELIDKLPADQKARLQGVRLSADSIAFEVPGVGPIEFQATELQAPGHVGFKAVKSPVPLNLAVDLADAGEGHTTVTPNIDIDIPAMLKPLVGGKIQEAADKFGELFTSLMGSK